MLPNPCPTITRINRKHATKTIFFTRVSCSGEGSRSFDSYIKHTPKNGHTIPVLRPFSTRRIFKSEGPTPFLSYSNILNTIYTKILCFRLLIRDICVSSTLWIAISGKNFFGKLKETLALLLRVV